MKKGFTLIELLAVIVILAIIALIAVPIILNIINDAKNETNERSIDLYASSVKNAVAKYQMKENKIPTSFSDIEKYIEYDGSEVICSTKELNTDGTIYLTGCTVNGEEVEYTYGKQQENNSAEINHLAKENVTAATTDTVTTGIVPQVDESGNIVSGSEFKIKVSDEIGELTFFVLSNDGDYVNLIAQKNLAPDGTLAGEDQDNDNWYVTQNNIYGPQTAYTYLSTAINSWTNIPLIESFSYSDEGNQENSSNGYQGIETVLDSASGNYITIITTLSSGNAVTYENMRARLPYYGEITTNTSCTSSSGSCPLWMVNYLKSSSYYSTDSEKVNSTENNYGYWTLSSSPGSINIVRCVDYNGSVSKYGFADNLYYGVRPVITVLKSDLLRVMN